MSSINAPSINKTALIKFLLQHNALQFGKFTLKSGRHSPYFLNLGAFKTGKQLTELGQYYAQAIQYYAQTMTEDTLMTKPSSRIESTLMPTPSSITEPTLTKLPLITEHPLLFDMLYGPAYKGIPLVTATSIALYRDYQQDYPYCFNRKEKKTHGEISQLVGETLQGRVLMVDDVITAGTTVNETLALFKAYPAQLTGIVILFDREEQGSTPKQSALAEVIAHAGVPVYPLLTLTDVKAYLSKQTDTDSIKILNAIEEYQAQYGCSSNEKN